MDTKGYVSLLPGWPILSSAVASFGEIAATEWLPALDDAEISDGAARLYLFEGVAPEDAEKAIMLCPGTDAFADHRFPVGIKQLAHANENRDLIRIGTYEDCEAPIMAGRLRHELEHARQWESFGRRILDFSQLLVQAVAERYAGTPGGALYYNTIPTEQDANAAAAVYVERRYPAESQVLLESRHEEAGLLRSRLGPEKMATLPHRMVAFAVTVGDALAVAADRRGFASAAALLEDCYSGAGRVFDACRSATLT